LKTEEQAFTNQIFVSEGTYKALVQANQAREPVYVELNEFVFTLSKNNKFGDGEIGLNKLIRQICRIDLVKPVEFKLFRIPQDQEFRLSHLQVELELIRNESTEKFEVDDKTLEEALKASVLRQFFKMRQMLLIKFENSILQGQVIKVQLMELGAKQLAKQRVLDFGMLVPETDIEFTLKVPG